MSRISTLGLVALAFILADWSGMSVQGSKSAPRQYYGAWQKHSRNNYYHRSYYYKPRDGYSGYKHHYTLYYPSKPDHYYYYNPYKKQYWGRCPSKHEDGKGTYSLLKVEDRKENLDDIDESKFPKPSTLPPIPDSTDDATLDLPPDDLPVGEGLPKGGK